jgi:hypothetical protein
MQLVVGHHAHCLSVGRDCHLVYIDHLAVELVGSVRAFNFAV